MNKFRVEYWYAGNQVGSPIEIHTELPAMALLDFLGAVTRKDLHLKIDTLPSEGPSGEPSCAEPKQLNAS